jgi:hypothetical protein
MMTRSLIAIAVVALLVVTMFVIIRSTSVTVGRKPVVAEISIC